MDRQAAPRRKTISKAFAPQWPRLLMGLGLATTMGRAVILGASLLAGIIWQMGNSLNQLHQEGRGSDQCLCPKSIWTEAFLGIAMFLMALLTFSIRSWLLIS